MIKNKKEERIALKEVVEIIEKMSFRKNRKCKRPFLFVCLRVILSSFNLLLANELKSVIKIFVVALTLCSSIPGNREVSLTIIWCVPESIPPDGPGSCLLRFGFIISADIESSERIHSVFQLDNRTEIQTRSSISNYSTGMERKWAGLINHYFLFRFLLFFVSRFFFSSSN